MYFNILPKQKREELYNYDEQYRELKGLLKIGHPLTAVVGVRRSGKTSLMSVVFNEVKGPKLWVDGRYLKDPKAQLPVLIKEALGSGHLIYGEIEASVGVAVAGVKVRMGAKLPLPSLEKLLKGKELHLFVDEAQRAGKELGDMLAYLYDRVPGIRMVVSGSEVGLLEEVLGWKDPKAPLFGRAVKEIPMPRLRREQAEEFLRLGFKEVGVKVARRELEEALDELDGLIGWLTLYGYRRGVLKERDGLKRTVEIAVAVVREELASFLRKRKNKALCLTILSNLSRCRRWKELYNTISSHMEVAESSFSYCLEELVAYSFVVKEQGEYCLADPLLSKAVVGMRGK